MLSTPNGANGLGLPSLPSGINTILESCRELKAGSFNIESFNLIVWTFNKELRNSSFTVCSPVTGFTAVVSEEEVNPAGVESLLKKKI